jgi:hypothetical protein
LGWGYSRVSIYWETLMGRRWLYLAAVLLAFVACGAEAPGGSDQENLGDVLLDDVMLPQEGVAKDSQLIHAWASGWVEPVAWGTSLGEQWMDPAQAIGPAEGDSTAIVSLGRGGELTLTFDYPIADGEGPDLAVFENSFLADFIELAFVEVSSDGQSFVRFPGRCLIEEPVSAFGRSDPEKIVGLAGKYPAGFGVPFDLADLSKDPLVLNKTLDLGHVTHVRIVDIIGDGSIIDSLGNPIYDPYPTTDSAGFDLDGVACMQPLLEEY